MELSELRSSINLCAESAKEWFFEKGTKKTHADWERHNKLDDDRQGAVYAFFEGKETKTCFYVGQTTKALKERARFEKSNHYERDWWGLWGQLVFVNIKNETDQKALELLLILALQPEDNQSPRARVIDEMFKAE